MSETFGASYLAIFGESLGCDIILQREMILGGLQILPYRHNLATDSAEIVHSLDNLFTSLAKPEHDTALAADTAFSYMAYHLQRVVISGEAAHIGSKATHCLQIMAYNFRTFRNHKVNKIKATFEVRNQHLHSDTRALRFDSPDHLGPMGGAEVGKIVTVNGCDHHMMQTEILYRLDNVSNLLLVKRERTTRSHIAEATAAGADISADHESGGAVAPTFTTVGTHAGAAYSVKMFLVQQTHYLAGLEPPGEFDLEPIGFSTKIGSEVLFLFRVVFHGG